MTTAPWRSVLILASLFFALTVFLMFDDAILYLLFEFFLGWKINGWAKFGVGAILTLANLALAWVAIKALQAKSQTGAEGLVGAPGIVERAAAPEYWVKVQGELWRAVSSAPLARGEKIVVRKVQGLTLEVEPWRTKVNGEGL